MCAKSCTQHGILTTSCGSAFLEEMDALPMSVGGVSESIGETSAATEVPAASDDNMLSMPPGVSDSHAESCGSDSTPPLPHDVTQSSICEME